MPTQFCTGTKCCSNHKNRAHSDEDVHCKDFVIIGISFIFVVIMLNITKHTGNGPSGIALSYFLSGNWPYYTAVSQDEFLHTRLMVEPQQSLVEQDLQFLSDVSAITKYSLVHDYSVLLRVLKEDPITQYPFCLMLFRSLRLILALSSHLC